MRLKFLGLALSAALFAAVPMTAPAWAAGPAGVTAPDDGDTYSRLVAQAEAGDPATDFRALRLAWLDSKARKDGASPLDLRQGLIEAANAGDHAKVRKIATQMVSIDYTSLEGHKFLRQSCKLLGDTACAEHEEFVEFGLLRSIVTDRDGKSPATAWQVISVDEEYFIMGVMGYRPGMQALVNQDGRVFDRMDVTDRDGKQLVLWFDITAFFGREFE